MPTVQRRFGEEPDSAEGTLLAPSPPPFRNERSEVEAAIRKVVDDLVDNLLWKRIHDELVIARDRTKVSGWKKPTWRQGGGC